MNIIELIKSQLTETVIDKVASSVGLSTNDAHKALNGLIPAQLDSIVKIGSTNTGAGHLLSLFQKFAGLGNIGSLLGKPDGMSGLLKMGESLTPVLFGKQPQAVFEGVGHAVGVSNPLAIGNLSKFVAPVIMSVLAGQTKGLNPLQLISTLGGLKTMLGGLLPAGLSGVLGNISGLGDGVANLNIPGLSAVAGVNHSSSHGGVGASVNSAGSASTGSSSKKGFPWWIPLLLLLGALAFALSMCNKQPAVSANTNTETTGTTDTGTTTNTGTMDAGMGTFALDFPKDGATVPFGGFTLKGKGKPGETVSIKSDGVDLSTVTVDADGNWSFDVPSDTAGAHKYSIMSAGKTVDFGATIDKPKAGMVCSSELTLSMADKQNVTQPFRFGGKGKGKGYMVTVKRGSRTVGTKEIALDAGCGWSYKSNPGVGPISYEIRELGAAATSPALKSISLTIQ